MHKSAVVLAFLALACLLAKFAWMDREFQAGRDALAQGRPNALLPMEQGGSASLLIDLRDWPAWRGKPILYLRQAQAPATALVPGLCVVEIEVTPVSETGRSARLDGSATSVVSFDWPFGWDNDLRELHPIADVRERVVLNLLVTESPYGDDAGLARLFLAGFSDGDIYNTETIFRDAGSLLTGMSILAGAIAAIQLAVAAFRKRRAQA